MGFDSLYVLITIANLPKHHATIASSGCEHWLVDWMPSHLGEYIWGIFKVQRLEKVGTSLNRRFGARLTALASFLWPLNVCISSFRFLRSKSWKGNIQQRSFNIEERSHTLSKWSLLAVMSQLPFWFQAQSITVDLWAWIVVSTWGDREVEFHQSLYQIAPYYLAWLGVPQLDWLLVVLASRDNNAFVWVPVHTPAKKNC